MLMRQKFSLAEPFYKRHRQHVLQAWIKTILRFILSVSVLALFCLLASRFGNKTLVLTAFLTLTLFLFWVGLRSLADLAAVRVVPYFERRIGGTSTFLTGKALLQHSNKLDQMALIFGVEPLSHFASGDDMMPGESVEWFAPDEALRTTRAILESESARKFSPELISDLSRLQHALELAVQEKVRFCLILREGSFSSPDQIEKRQGSFY